MKMAKDKRAPNAESRTFSDSKLSYVMYVLILIVAIGVVYFVVMQYIRYQTIFTADDSIEIVIDENTVDAVKEEMHPYLVAGVDSTKKVSITLEVSAPGYSMTYTSEGAVDEFRKGMMLPRELFGKELTLSAAAEDRNGFVLHTQKTVTLEEEPEVLFQIG